MANTIMPSTGLLPMDDIANELAIKYQFSSKGDSAVDTQQVAGTDSNLIAIAATDPSTGILITDRETIKNALQLGGKAAEEYLTKEGAAKLEDFTNKISSIFTDEITSLRDEVYQIRGELAKQGLINEYNLYEGFQDFFRLNNPKYLVEPVCGIKIDAMGPGVNKIYPEAPTEFNIGDFFVIHKDSDVLNNFKESKTLVEVIDKNEILGEITFSPALTDLAKDNVKLYKSLGQYNKGSYSFSKIEKNAVIEKEKYTMLNDDTNTIPLVIDTSKTGYGITFKVPDTVAGALTKLSVKAKASGTPGSLVCYVMKESASLTFRNISEASANGDIIAASRPVTAGKASTWSMIDFDFQSPSTGEYPILDGQRYCFVIEAINANKMGDHWELMFSYFKDSSSMAGDLQKNNTTYRYKEIEVSDPDMSKTALTLSGDIGNYDMFFILTTKEIASEYETAYKEGLYSAKVNLPAPINVSRARLMLRINREGNYVTTSSPGAYNDGNIFSIGLDPNVGSYNLTYGTGIDKNDLIAIDTNIRRLNNVNNSQLVLEKGAYIGNQDIVYRIGYKVLLRASLVEWDQTSNSFVTKNEQHLELPLSAIIPDGNKVALNISDRLLFEGDFANDSNDIPKYANNFEIQIKWDSNFPLEAMSINKDLIGKIHDLSLSFDKTY